MQQSKDFEISRERRVVVIRCLGAWDRDAALAFQDALMAFLDPWVAGETWATLVDFSHWRTTDPEVAALGNRTRDLMDARGRRHGAFLFGSLVVAEKLIERGVIDPSSRRVRYFQTEETARTWLASLGYLDAGTGG